VPGYPAVVSDQMDPVESPEPAASSSLEGHDRSPDGALSATDAGGDGAAFVPSDNTTLTSILAGLAAEGYDHDFSVVADVASMRCDACDTVSPAESFAVDAIRRLEGASEPDEMLSVVIGRCPACQARGVAVLGYGPAASADDAAVATRLRT
jgi:hypothetical protein